MVKKVTVTLEDIKLILSELLENKITREKASAWALNLRKTGDEMNLEYSPQGEENKIWEALLFIEGIDLQDDPTSYLHNDIDIKRFLQKL